MTFQWSQSLREWYKRGNEMKKAIKFYAPILFLLLILVDAHITNIVENIFEQRLFAVSSLFFIAMIPAVKHLSMRYILILALVMGYIFDTYYIGIIGINMLLFPIVAYFIKRQDELINHNVMTEFFAMIIYVTVYNVGSFLIQALFSLAHVDVVQFITKMLGPTLILNLAIFWVTIYIFRFLFRTKEESVR
jgi:rod shape-determining protein MreD